MSKPTKQQTEHSQPKAVETSVQLTEIALRFHDDKPNLGTVSRIAGRASRLLRISDLDERISVENAATVALAKKLSLLD